MLHVFNLLNTEQFILFNLYILIDNIQKAMVIMHGHASRYFQNPNVKYCRHLIDFIFHVKCFVEFNKLPSDIKNCVRLANFMVGVYYLGNIPTFSFLFLLLLV